MNDYDGPMPPADDPGGGISWENSYIEPDIVRWRWPDLFWWLR